MKLKTLITVSITILLMASCTQTKKETATKLNKEVVEKTVEEIKEIDYGIITKQSFVDVKTTMDRLEKIISKKEGIRVFIRINHAENLRKTGAENVADSELVIFGNPKVGLKMLSKDPRSGLDLPLKIIAYAGKDGKTYISYRDVLHYSNIYNLEGCEAKKKMSGAISKLSDIIIKSPEDFKLFLEKAKTKK